MQGPAGPQGPAGTGVTWRGAWSDTTAYVANDAVAVNGTTYIALDATTNDPPASSPAKWQVLAQKGADGAQGSEGPQGPAGADGADATNLWAVVASTGTLSRGSGVTSVSRISTGTYRVQFNQTIHECAWNVQAAPTGTGTSFQGLAQPSLSATGNDRVIVNTWNANLVATDLPFHLTVFC